MSGSAVSERAGAPGLCSLAAWPHELPLPLTFQVRSASALTYLCELFLSFSLVSAPSSARSSVCRCVPCGYYYYYFSPVQIHCCSEGEVSCEEFGVLTVRESRELGVERIVCRHFFEHSGRGVLARAASVRRRERERIE